MITLAGTSSCGAIPFDTEEIENLVWQYFNSGFTVKEIVASIMCVNFIIVSERTVKRVLRRLNLRRRTESSLRSIVDGIRWLHTQGYSNYGHKWIWHLLNYRLGIRAHQETVRHALLIMDPDGVTRRRQRRLRRRQYVNRGPNFVIHIDGYDKLKPFGISIHGAIDGFSRKIVWLKAGPSNKNPRFISYYYLNFLMELKRVPRMLRFDAGTENVYIRDIHMALRMNHSDSMSGLRSCSTGRSTGNQRIEMLWSILMRGFTSFWRNFFKDMIDEGLFNNADPLHVECILLCFLPTIQRHLDHFAESWNGHRIRSQRSNECPSGIPNIMYHQPLMYHTRDYSFDLPCDVNDLSVLVEQFSQRPPVCSNEMFQLASIVCGLNEHYFEQVRSPNMCKSVFESVITRIEQLL